jgi:hypothetical protein
MLAGRACGEQGAVKVRPDSLVRNRQRGQRLGVSRRNWEIAASVVGAGSGQASG